MLSAAIVADKSVRPRRGRVSITPYELRVFPAHLDGDRRRRGRERIVTLARVTSGSGRPAWMGRAVAAIASARPVTVDEARAIVEAIRADRHRQPSAARLIPAAWVANRPITPEETLAAAGIDSARQAAYQRKMSALLAGRA